MKLIFSTIMSLDGLIADAHGNFDWAMPDEEVHQFINDLERPVGTYLYGRRMYETMVYWETGADEPDCIRDFTQIWRAADKVVYSRSLASVTTTRTRIERDFDPGAVRAMKDASAKDITVGGPHLAAQAIEAGLVDELQLFIAPAVVGSGNPAFPGRRLAGLELREERRFRNGFVFVRYQVS